MKAFGLALATEVAIFALCLVWVLADIFLPILLIAITHPAILVFYLLDIQAGVARPVSIGLNIVVLTFLWRYILRRRARAAASAGSSAETEQVGQEP
jgi:hypothetical protein